MGMEHNEVSDGMEVEHEAYGVGTVRTDPMDTSDNVRVFYWNHPEGTPGHINIPVENLTAA